MTTLSRQYHDLERAIAADESQRIVEVANTILAANANEKEAAQAKAVAQLRLGQHDAAAETLNKLTAQGVNVSFHLAYAYYRSGKSAKGVELLEALPSPTRGEKLLLGQMYYKLEQYAEAAKAFDALLASTPSTDPEYLELLTNCNAARSMGGLPLVGSEADNKRSYELAFNAASVAVRDGDLTGAESLLNFAIEQCKAYFAHEGEGAEELASELAPILTQLGLVKQRQGRSADALALYETVVKSKANDVATLAVALSNIVSIKQEHELFESAKRLKTAFADTTRPRLISWQQRTLRYNNALLAAYMGKFGHARQLATELSNEKAAGSVSLSHLVNATAALREKDVAAALAELEPHSSGVPVLRLTQIQCLISLGRIDEAVALLREVALELPSKAALGSAVCSLYEKLNRASDAVAFVDAIRAKSTTPDMVRFSAQFRLLLGDSRGAIADLEQVVKNDASDIESLAALVKAYATVDAAKAAKYAELLPDTSSALVDVDALESAASRRGYRLKKKDDETPGSPTSPTTATAAAAAVPAKAKAKRKRKIRLPKNLDPANRGKGIDPERWIPKRMRSSFRPKKKKNRDAQVKGGAQGAAGGSTGVPAGSYERNEPLDKSSAASASNASASPSSSGSSSKPKRKGKSKW